MQLDNQNYKKVSIKEVTTPKAGKICYGPSWWVTDGENVFFYKNNRPQCNSDKRVLQYVYPEYESIFIEIAFLEHNCRDYF